MNKDDELKRMRAERARSKEPRLTREKAMQIHKERLEKKPDEGGPVPVSWDYRKRVIEAAERALRAKSMTHGISTAMKKNEPIVAIVCQRRGEQPWVQKADCQVAFEDGVEPEFLGRTMVEELEENLERVRRGESP